jgi:hypothetical protein
VTTPIVAEPAVVTPRRRGPGIASLVLGILLVVGVALWLVIGGILMPALVWVFPIVVIAAFIIAAVHFIVAVIALVLGIQAVVKNRGRVTGAIGIALTVIATAATVLVGVFFGEVVNVLYNAGTTG